MNYYKDDSRVSRRWAWVALLIYVVLISVALLTVRVELSSKSLSEAIIVELAPLPETPPQPEPLPKVTEAPMHEEYSEEDANNEVRGDDTETRSPNPRALFRQSQSGVDEPEDAANPRAKEDEREQSSGRGTGTAPKGSDMLDTGLQGRGLVGDLPLPRYQGDVEGKVLITVTVDASGRVTSAVYEPKGSTISDPGLIAEARSAAMKARFTESRSHLQGGVITYIFTLKR